MEKENPQNVCSELHQHESGSKANQTNDVQDKIPHVLNENVRKNLKRKLSQTEFESKEDIIAQKLTKSEDHNNSGDSISFSSESNNKEIHLTKLKYKCSFENCNQYFHRERDLDKHEFHHNGVEKYSCDFPNCVKKYRLRAHLKRHKIIFHEKKKNNEVQLKCDIENCDRLFANKYNLKRHIKEFHETVRNKFACTECDRVYERKIHLDLHLTEHTKKYPFKCFKCDKGFVNEGYLKRHHCSEQNTCDICEKNFKKWSELIKHRNTEHQLYNCTECNDTFESKQKLILHKKNHKNRVYCVWEGCSNSYSDRRNLKSHINTKHLGQKHMCTVDGCNKEFIFKSSLKKHLRFHEKPSTIVKQSNKTKIRKKRKDAGIPKTSIVNLLANIVTRRESAEILENGNYNHKFEEDSSEDNSLDVTLEINRKKSNPIQIGKNL